MKKHSVTAAAAALCLLLSGCGGLSLNGGDILTPPKAQGDQAQIQQLIREEVGDAYEMIYPESGEYKSSVFFTDLDSDEDEEAIALYSPDRETARVLIADKSGNSYTLYSESTILSNRITQLEFADFDGDDHPEILITYPGSAATLQSLTVLSLGDKISRSDISDACAAHIVGDYTGNAKDDLLTLDIADGKSLPTARLYIGDNDTLVEQSSCEIASDTKEYLNISYGKISGEINGAIIDAKNDDGEYSTQMICYDYNARGIINPLYVNNSYTQTKRAVDITSADIDRDGVIEIPLCKMMDYAQSEESSAVCERIDWSSYDYEQLSLVTKQSAVLCDRLGFILNLSAEHADIVTARYIGADAMSIYLWEYKRNTPTRTTKLLTVKRYKKSDYDGEQILEAVAAKSNDYVYTYVIDAEEGFYGYTDEEIINNFVLIEEQTTE